ncbi:MAG: antirepressor regulating drug resistance protein [Planctomycetaceae bacterium]|nr:antirepressor regulating drug resistance protein [Planctomycetaceae bacterium]
MISLVETGLMNALLAVLLALPVLALGRIWQRPALIHAFWILVLVKLIAPPLYLIPVRLNLPARPATEMVDRISPASSLSAVVATSHSLSPSSQFAVQRTDMRSADVNARTNSWTQYCQGWVAIALRFLQRLALPILCLWFCGSMCWFTLQGWRVVRFTQVFLKYARRGPLVLQQLAQRLAEPMGIAKAPEVWLLPAVVSPMLWSVGGKPRILFPKDLLCRLDEGAVATLLTHELAHYRRGDHRVRLLEFLASGLFWWHPVLWLARRELEISEEKCCDAWVVSQFPAAQRQYADALLATVDFLTEGHPGVPAAACGLGEVPLLRQRLKLIMRGTAPKSLSLLGRMAVVATAMLIPISPSLRLREQPVVHEAAAKSTTVPRPRPTAISQVTPVKVSSSTAIRRPVAIQSRLVARLEPRTATASSAAVPGAPSCNSNSDEVLPGSEPVSVPRASPPDADPTVTASQFILRVLGQPEERGPASAPDLQDVFDFVTGQSSSSLFTAHGKVSLTGSRDGTVLVWNLHNSIPDSHTVAIRTGCRAPECASTCDAEKHSADSANHDLARYWNADEKCRIEPATMSPRGVNSLAISPQGLTLATSLTGPRKTIALTIIRFTANGKLLVATEWHGTLVTWDLGTQVRISK